MEIRTCKHCGYQGPASQFAPNKFKDYCRVCAGRKNTRPASDKSFAYQNSLNRKVEP